jgi:hypothetical protein
MTPEHCTAGNDAESAAKGAEFCSMECCSQPQLAKQQCKEQEALRDNDVGTTQQIMMLWHCGGLRALHSR